MTRAEPRDAADQPTAHSMAPQQRLRWPGAPAVPQLRNLTLGLLILLLNPYCVWTRTHRSRFSTKGISPLPRVCPCPVPDRLTPRCSSNTPGLKPARHTPDLVPGVSRIMAPQDVHVLIPEPGGCVAFRGRRNFADGIKLRTLRRGSDSG